MWPITNNYFGNSTLVLYTIYTIYLINLIFLSNNCSKSSSQGRKIEFFQSLEENLGKNSYLKTKFEEKFKKIQNDSRRSYSTQIRTRRQKIGGILQKIPPKNVPFSEFRDQKKESEAKSETKNIKLKKCSDLKVQFSNETFLARAVVSFPGSGSSWLLNLIEKSSGLFTYSLSANTNKKTSVLKRTLLQDTSHLFDTYLEQRLQLINQNHSFNYKSSINWQNERSFNLLSSLFFGYRGVLLVLNPYDAFINYWTLKTKQYPTEWNNPENWRNFVIIASSQWTSLIKNWVKNSRDLFITQFETLKSSPEQELIRILKYLNQPIDNFRLKCVLNSITNYSSEFYVDKDCKNAYFDTNMDKTGQDGKNSDKNQDKTGENDENYIKNSTFELKYDKNMKNDEYFFNDDKSSLDLIVQRSIDDINKFLAEENYLLQLNYTLLNSHCFNNGYG